MGADRAKYQTVKNFIMGCLATNYVGMLQSFYVKQNYLRNSCILIWLFPQNLAADYPVIYLDETGGFITKTIL